MLKSVIEISYTPEKLINDVTSRHKYMIAGRSDGKR
jgi:hypothetical protein